MKRLLYLILFATFHCELSAYLSPEKNLSQFSHGDWDVSSGLSSNWVNAISKEANSPFLWIATPTGLIKFDGVGFETFDSSYDPKLQGGIWSQTLDQDGKLMIGTKNSGLLEFKDGRLQKVWDAKTKGPSEIRVVQVDSKNRIWMGTPSGLFKLDNGEISEVKPFDTVSVWVESIHEDPNGVVWIGTQENGLFQYREGLEPVLFDDGSGSMIIHSIKSDVRGDLWVGTKQGLYRLSGDGYTQRYTTRDGLPSNAVRSLYLDKLGCLWIGTEKGVIRYFKNKMIPSEENAPFANKYITCFLQDEEGSMWVGTKYNGFGQIWNAKFSVVGQPEGLENEVVNVVYEDADESLWVGTNGGCYRVYDGDVTEVFANVLGKARIRDIFRDSNGTMWFCTYSGVFCENDGVLEPFSRESELSSSLARQVMEDSNGAIWIGTRSGVNRLDRNGELIQWSVPVIRNDFILHIIEDRTGAIWISTDGGGIARLDKTDGEFHWITQKDGLIDGVVFKMHEDKEGLLWLATAKGISVVRDGKVTNIGPEYGLPSETVFQVLEDKYGYFWITAHEGIFKVRRSDLVAILDGVESRLKITRYGPLDGLRTYQMTGVGESQLLSNGHLAFASAAGLALLDPTSIELNAYKPEVVLNKITVDGETIDSSALTGDQPLVLSNGFKKLKIDYTATSMIGANNIIFSTQLVGFDEVRTMGNDRSLVYTNLDPGTYELLARATNADGIFGNEKSLLEFKVMPHFRQTIWFFLIIVLVSILVAYVFYSLRLVKLKGAQKQLETQVNKRTEEISKQKAVIEAKNLEIEKNLRDLRSTNVELKKLNQEKSYILGVAAHDMKNPLGNIMNLAEFLITDEKLKDCSTYDDVQENLSLIQSSSRELLDLVNTLVDSVVLETGEIRLEKDQEDIASIARSVVALNKPYAEDKGQTLLYSGPQHVPAFVDSLRVRAAIDNYLSNAIKYSPRDSEIEIRLSDFKADEHRWARVEVVDQGPGLKGNDFENVFERFSKLSAKPTGLESSSGMGLAIVKQIVELHGGSVSVANQENGGACFRFDIPLG